MQEEKIGYGFGIAKCQRCGKETTEICVTRKGLFCESCIADLTFWGDSGTFEGQPSEGVTPEEKRALLEAMDEGRPPTGLITSMLLHYIGLMMRKEAVSYTHLTLPTN